MAIRPTIRLINANWHDQTVVAFCSARCASHRGRKKRQRGRSPREAVGFPRFDGLIWKIGRVSEERRKKNARGKEMCMCIYIYTYLLFSELGLENIGGVADGPHFLQPSFHSRQPDLHLVPFRLVSLAVPEHRVQLRLPLHHFRVHLVPVLPQLRNWNNNRADVPFSNVLFYTIITPRLYVSQPRMISFFSFSVSHCACGKKYGVTWHACLSKKRLMC